MSYYQEEKLKEALLEFHKTKHKEGHYSVYFSKNGYYIVHESMVKKREFKKITNNKKIKLVYSFYNVEVDDGEEV